MIILLHLLHSWTRHTIAILWYINQLFNCREIFYHLFEWWPFIRTIFQSKENKCCNFYLNNFLSDVNGNRITKFLNDASGFSKISSNKISIPFLNESLSNKEAPHKIMLLVFLNTINTTTLYPAVKLTNDFY